MKDQDNNKEQPTSELAAARQRFAGPEGIRIMSFFSLIGAGTLRILGNFGAIVVFFSLAFVNIFRSKAAS